MAYLFLFLTLNSLKTCTTEYPADETSEIAELNQSGIIKVFNKNPVWKV